MSKELEALNDLINLLEDEHLGLSEIEYVIKRKKIIETALENHKNQDNIISIIKATIEFNIQEPKMEVKENGEISLLSRVEMSLRKQLNEKEKELFREWVLKECFPEELKA